MPINLNDGILYTVKESSATLNVQVSEAVRYVDGI
jgi:hypothetical protein